jgi:hypothetical protein
MDSVDTRIMLISVGQIHLLILVMRVEEVLLLLEVRVSHLDTGGSVGDGTARFDLVVIVAWLRLWYHLQRSHASHCRSSDESDRRTTERCSMHACRR